jgi:threonine synthase
MNYYSTRSGKNSAPVSAAQAIKQGLADDGGLFMPESIPALAPDALEKLAALDYPHRAAEILGMFLTDYSYDELLADAELSYAPDRFVGGAAPVKHIGGNFYALELWHGPTAAFKDMALQIMPRLLTRALKKTGEERTATILVATSGDTGKAALEGYRDIDQIKIQVFYPQNGVSRVQKLQMATQLGNNVDVCAIEGNFDDAQSGVKKIFADKAISDELSSRGFFLSSANSINWGRLAPQIVYYISAYCDMMNSGSIKLGDEIDVCVPTGNFGNIFAAYIARRMGLPLGRLVCASNCNNVLTDFIESGKYDRNREFHTTMSPSMDILISSNLERLIYTVAGEKETARCMSELASRGEYTVSESTYAEIAKTFVGYYSSEEQTAEAIKNTWEKNGYLMDTHTGVAYSCARRYADKSGTENKILVVSTASAYKFASDVYESIFSAKPEDPLAALDMLSEKTSTEIAYPLRKIGERKLRFERVINPCDMEKAVLDFAK